MLALAREGCELYVSARGRQRLEKTCAAIAEETGASITPVCADHSTDEGRRKILTALPGTRHSGRYLFATAPAGAVCTWIDGHKNLMPLSFSCISMIVSVVRPCV